MTRGTTPTLVLEVDDYDLTTLKSVYITIKQKEIYTLTKKLTDRGVEIVSEHEIDVYLTQEETLRFRPGIALVDIRAVDNDGNAVASDEPQELQIGDILLDGIIS